MKLPSFLHPAANAFGKFIEAEQQEADLRVSTSNNVTVTSDNPDAKGAAVLAEGN